MPQHQGTGLILVLLLLTRYQAIVIISKNAPTKYKSRVSLVFYSIKPTVHSLYKLKRKSAMMEIQLTVLVLQILVIGSKSNGFKWRLGRDEI